MMSASRVIAGLTGALLLLVPTAGVTARQTAAAAPARDFSGVWMPSHWYHLLGGGDPGNLPRNTLFSFPLPKAVAEREALLTPWGRERLATWTPQNDPDARCLSPGAVRAYQSPYPIEFLQTTGRVTILVPVPAPGPPAAHGRAHAPRRLRHRADGTLHGAVGRRHAGGRYRRASPTPRY